MTRGPLISAIMPSKRDAKAILEAFENFAAQTYNPKEIAVVRTHDKKLPKFECVLPNIGAQSVITMAGGALGELRNIACRAAQGSLIAIWDDDDFSAPSRLERSVEMLREYEIVGTSLAYFVDPKAKRRWLWDGKKSGVEYATLLGGSLAFRREVWERGNFDPWKQVGEDVDFMQRHLAEPKIGQRNFFDFEDPDMYTATISDDNTCVKHTEDRMYTEVEWKE